MLTFLFQITLPESIFKLFIKQRSSVVFPIPLFPIIAIRSPDSILTENLLITSKLSKLLLSLSTSRAEL